MALISAKTFSLGKKVAEGRMRGATRYRHSPLTLALSLRERG
ncbi:hypothetical protein [Geobacter metallireducens]|nr:hypothetical protein [Geobacter metallireducens]